jgi:hypothetical protein
MAHNRIDQLAPMIRQAGFEHPTGVKLRPWISTSGRRDRPVADESQLAGRRRSVVWDRCAGPRCVLVRSSTSAESSEGRHQGFAFEGVEVLDVGFGE